MINTTSERLKARNFFICRYSSFYEQDKFHAQLSMKSFITSGPGLNTINPIMSMQHLSLCWETGGFNGFDIKPLILCLFFIVGYNGFHSDGFSHTQLPWICPICILTLSS